MLLSVVNTNLRDFYGSLEQFCQAKDVDQEQLKTKLKTIGYEYDEELHQFK